MFPDTPTRLIGVDKSTPEIPTVKSEIEQFKDVLGRLPLENCRRPPRRRSTR